MLVVFAQDLGESPTMTGADVRALDGRDQLLPGADVIPVSLRFWWEGAAALVGPGTAFELWYGRTVGAGRIA